MRDRPLAWETMTAPLSAWLEGARPNTLPASVAPVIAGLAAAVTVEQAGDPFASVRWGVLALTAVVALLGVMLLVVPVRDMLAGASGRSLIPMLRSTSMAELGMALGLLVGVFLA